MYKWKGNFLNIPGVYILNKSIFNFVSSFYPERQINSLNSRVVLYLHVTLKKEYFLQSEQLTNFEISRIHTFKQIFELIALLGGEWNFHLPKYLHGLCGKKDSENFITYTWSCTNNWTSSFLTSITFIVLKSECQATVFSGLKCTNK